MRVGLPRNSRAEELFDRAREIAQRTGLKEELRLVLPSTFGILGLLIAFDIVADKFMENPADRPLDSAIRKD